MKVSLNVKSNSDANKDVVKEKVSKAKKEKKIPTMEESWELIFSRKNSAPEIARLEEVKEAFASGKIGREPGKENKAFTKAEALRLYAQLQEMEREAKLKEMANKEWDKYPLITEDKLKEWVEGCLNADNNYFAMDFETVGDNGGKYKYREEIAGFSLTYRLNGKLINGYVPMKHYRQTATEEYVLDERNISPEEGQWAITQLFHTQKESIWHNATFDLGLARAAAGVEAKHRPHDTMIIMKLLDENLNSYKLKDLATKYLGIPSDTFEQLFGKKAKFGYIPLDAARWYGAKDTYVGFLLFEWQMEILNRPNFAKIKKVYDKIEHPCIMNTHIMESEGFVIDMEEVKKQRTEGYELLNKLEKELHELWGDINIGSPQQLAKFLYVDRDWSKYVSKDGKSILRGHIGFDENGISNNKLFGLENGKKLVLNPTVGAKGKLEGDSLSVDSEALEKIAKHEPEVKLLQRWKDEAKHLSSFVDKIDSFIQPDGKLHGDFKQVGTVTLRYAAADPNLQQQPYKARRMFTVDDESIIMSADFSQQEPRLLTHMSKCKALIEVYNEGRDLYSEMASAIFNKPIEECGDGSVYRKRTKVVVLAIMYGMSAWSLGDSLGVSKDEAQAMIDDFFKVYPEVDRWITMNQNEVIQQHYVETPFGTRRRFKDVDFTLLKKNYSKLSGEEKKAVSAVRRALRQTTNFKVQGSAAMQTKLVVNAMNNKLVELSAKRSKKRCFNFLAQVHDELLFKIPKDAMREEINQIVDVMINTVPLVVPSKTDVALGTHWGSLVDMDEWFKDKGEA